MKNRRIPTLVLLWALSVICLIGPVWTAQARSLPFAPGEKLKYELRWENIPAGEALLEVGGIKEVNGIEVYHFVMTAKSNAFVDIFYKVRDRIDAFADTQMTRSVYYKKKQTEGNHKRYEVIDFDWEAGQAKYLKYGRKRGRLDVMPGSFDPLSAFYYTRMALADGEIEVERPVTDGKRNVIGRVRVVRRETITLTNGMTFDTLCLAPEMDHIGGVFKQSEGAKIYVWVTDDDRHIPVQIKSKIAIGHFIGELVSSEGI